MILENDTMTALERFKTVINHEEPDRLPIFLMGVFPYSKCYIELMEQEDTILDEFTDNDENVVITPLGDFTIRYFFGAEVETVSVGLISNFTPKHIDKEGNILGDFDLNEKNKLLSELKKRNLINSDSDDQNKKSGINGSESNSKNISNKHASGQGLEYRIVTYEGRVQGFTILPNGQEYSWYIDGYLKKEEDILNWYDTYGWMHEKKIRDIDLKNYNDAVSQFGDRLVFVPQIGGSQLFESTWPIMGFSRFSYYCRKKPELIHKLVESRKQAQLNMLDRIEKLKPDAVFGGDDLGQKGRSLISPAIFRKFFKEPYKEIFDRIHDMGAIAFNHGCGNMTDLLPDYIEAGLDGWQSLEPDSLIDHAALKKKYGDRFLFVGGLNQSYMTEPGVGPKEVAEHVKKQIKKMAKGGGYIAGPAHDYLNVPLENALALRDAVYKYGRYPID